ncbi:growth/differentiation factor 8 isoform X2 [Anoplolepis gracilipes]|uniref:growth/differentiation factor 8 isoform X2 n=1 Tax=Anoplolepis gracilipes TaxID=354296 RepID=UPI003B9EB732
MLLLSMQFFIILLVGGIVADWSKMTSPLMKVWYTFLPHSSSESSTSKEDDCAGCAQNKVNMIDPDPFLTELRVEYVKQQILKKLRLSKPPEVSMPLSTLPKPLINGNVLELRPGAPPEPEKPAEHFYGKTDQIIVFPNEGVADSTKYRQSWNHITGFNPAACFTFYLPNEMLYVDVTSAELWFYKEQVENDDELKQTFVLSELDHWDLGGSFEKNTVMAIFETDIREGWVKTDMKFMMKKWISRHRLKHAIQIACTTCSTDHDIAPVSTEQTLKPFLVIHTAPLPLRNRPKRNSNCLPDMKECCRDDLYINFRDIGWSDWILHPSGYHAYFCRGSCSTAASLTMSSSGYNHVIRLLTRDASQQKNKIVPCCSPTQLAPLQLLYIDTNNTITQKTLPNMVVEACGCM